MRNHILLLGFAVAASPHVVSAQICSIPGPHETPKCSYLIANPECWIDLENVAEALVAPPSIRLKPGAEIWIGVPKQAGQSISLDPKYADVPSPDAVAAILERIAPSIPSIAIGSSINFGDDNKSLAISGLAQLGVASRTVAMDFIRRLEAAERQLRELVDTLQTIEAQQKELADQLRSRKDSLEKSVKALQDTAKARDRVQFETAKKKFIDTAGCREAAGKEPTCDALAPLLTDRATKAAFAKFLEELPDRPERLAAIVAALDAIVEDSANHDSVDDLNAFIQADVVPRARRLRQVATSLVQLEAKSLDRVAANEELIAHTITNLSAAQALLRTGVSASWFITPEFGYCEKLPGSQTPSTLWNPGLNRRAEVTVSGTDGLSGKKTALTTVKLAWAASRWEMSVGALISTLADRSFANTTLIENGMPVPRVVDDMTDETTITNQTRITERTTVPSAVPMFFTHYRLADGLAGAHRFGVMTAVGIGVNPSTGTADFSTGLSFTIGRFAITPLAHFGRDERLTNGLKVGQDLGVSAPALSTEKFWTTRFAIGLSYLIPIK